MFPFPLCIPCITAHICGFRRSQELSLQRFSISSGLRQPRTSTVTECHRRMPSCSRHSEAPLQCCRQGFCYRRLLQFLLPKGNCSTHPAIHLCRQLLGYFCFLPLLPLLPPKVLSMDTMRRTAHISSSNI